MRIGGFQKTTLVDYPGKVASIVFTSSCNMRCGYCYNAPLACGSVRTVVEKEILGQLEERKKWVDAVVVTGGEPTVWPDLPDFLGKLKAMGLSVKLDTNGTNPEMLSELFSRKLVDYVAMDIKAPWAKYQQVCGARLDVGKIRRSADLIKFSGIDYEFRTTAAPSLDASDLAEIGRQISPAKRWFLQHFVPAEKIMEPSLLAKQAPKLLELEATAKAMAGQFGECAVRGA